MREPVSPTERRSNTVAQIENNCHDGNMEQQTAATQGDAQQLTAMLTQMMGQINELRTEQANEREATRTQIRILQENLASLQATPSGITPQPASPTDPSQRAPTPPQDPLPQQALPAQVKKKMTLPDPPRFDGTRKKFRTWKQEMESKLETDGPAIGTKRDQFSYIFARLAEGPQAMSAAYFDHHKRNGTTEPAEFLQYLSSCFADPNLTQKALDKLGSMTQGDKEPFASFLPKFEKELADADGAGWTSAVKISYLKKALNREMRMELKGQLNMPNDYHQYVRALHDLGANLDEFRSFSQRRNAPWDEPKKMETPPPRATSPDKMDWEPTKINRAIQKQNKELAGKRAKWVSEEEVQRRRREGLCTRCGRKGCWSNKCPLLPPRHPDQTRIKKSFPKLPAVKDMVDSESDASDQMESDGEELKE